MYCILKSRYGQYIGLVYGSCQRWIFFFLVAGNPCIIYTACYGRQKYPQKVSSFGNFLSGTFAKKSFVARSVWGEEKFVPGTGGIWRRVALTLIPEKVATS